MSESLCADCPLRERHPDLDIPYINLEIKTDAGMLARQKGGDELMAAVSAEHPERCEKLRAILSKPTVTKHNKPFAECPEIGLFQLLYK